MSTYKAERNLMLVGNEQGFTLLGVLMLSLFIGLTQTVLLTRIDSDRQAFQRAHTRVDTEFMQTTVAMMLSKRPACLANLDAAHFGTSLNQLPTRKNVALALPGGLTMATIYPGLTVRRMSFGQPLQIHPLDSAFAAILSVELAQPGSSVTRTAEIPFLFETDGAGQLVSCYATSPSPSGRAYVAIENDLCAQNGGDLGFRYAKRFCSNGITLAPSGPGMPGGVQSLGMAGDQ